MARDKRQPKPWFVLVFQCFDTSVPPRIVVTDKQQNFTRIINRQASSDFDLISITSVVSEREPHNATLTGDVHGNTDA